jgi:L-seryl-tRNA(Ser) seleniumtransferase
VSQKRWSDWARRSNGFRAWWVINATGEVLHTNLGRAPLSKFESISGYSNPEYDVHAGKRGKRDVPAGGLLERLAGAPAIAVNNNAAAIFLALHELAHGYKVTSGKLWLRPPLGCN